MNASETNETNNICRGEKIDNQWAIVVNWRCNSIAKRIIKIKKHSAR